MTKKLKKKKVWVGYVWKDVSFSQMIQYLLLSERTPFKNNPENGTRRDMFLTKKISITIEDI